MKHLSRYSRLLAFLLRRRFPRRFRQWAAPTCNPFLQKFLRHALRSKELPRFVQNTLLAIIAVNALGWVIWYVVRRNDASLIAQFPSLAHLPGYLGANPIGFSALLTTATVYGVGAIAPMLKYSPLRDEVLRDTLPQLQLLPIPEERWLWLLTAQSFAQPILAWCLGLPVFAFAVFFDQWSSLDVLGLLLIFLALGVPIPLYAPRLWQQERPRKDRAQPVRGEKARKDAGMQSVGISQLALESHSYKDRADITGESQMAADPVVTDKVAAGDLKKDTAETLTLSGITGLLKPIILFFALMVVWLSVDIARGTSSAALTVSLTSYYQQQFSESYQALLAALPLTLPYLLAHLLFMPLPFFVFVLPPVLLSLPFVVAWKLHGLQRVASRISGFSTFWTTGRQLTRTRINRALVICSFIALNGYCWTVLMRDGILGLFIAGGLANPDWAMAAAWTVALMVGCIRVRLSLKKAFTTEGTILKRWRDATKSAIHLLLQSVTVYFVLCWLGGLSGVGIVWLARLPLTLFTALAFCVEAFGSNALRASLPKRLRPVLGLVRWWWSYGLVAEMGVRVVAGVINSTASGGTLSSSVLSESPYLLLSPFVSLWLLFQDPVPMEVTRYGALWWGPVVQLIIGAACTMGAIVLDFQQRKTTEEVGFIYNLFRALLSPLLFISNELRRGGRIVIMVLRLLVEWIRRWDTMLLRWGQKMDNPILVAELRRRMRSTPSAAGWLFLPIVEGAFFVISLCPPDSSPVPLRGGPLLAEWSIGAVYVITAGLSIFPAVASMAFTTIFSKDRINGALVFLFLTPLTNREILFGKVAPGLFDGAVYIATALPWLCLTCLAALLSGNSIVFALAPLGLLAACSLFLLSSSAAIRYATRPGYEREVDGPDSPLVKPPSNKPPHPAPNFAGQWLTATAWPAGIIGCTFAGAEAGCVLLYNSPLLLCGILLAAIVVQTRLAFLYWQAALRALAEQRTGDVSLTGKVILN